MRFLYSYIYIYIYPSQALPLCIISFKVPHSLTPSTAHNNMRSVVPLLSIIHLHLACIHPTSNEMSTLAHKTIYIDVFTGEEQPILDSLKDHHVALTQMETSLASIHNALRAVSVVLSINTYVHSRD